MSCREQRTASEVISVEQQYRNAAYSKYVESPRNCSLYAGYLHYSLFKIINPILEINSCNKRILDIGCGNAILGRKIKLLFPDVYVLGVDLSAPMLEEAANLINRDNISSGFDLLNCDVADLPKDIGEFDCIISGFVMAHLSTKECVYEYFVQVFNYLNTGGVTVHIIPDCDCDEGSAVKANLPYMENDVEKFIELYDFKWSESTYREAALRAGLTDVCIQPGELCPASDIEEPLPIHIVMLSARKL